MGASKAPESCGRESSTPAQATVGQFEGLLAVSDVFHGIDQKGARASVDDSPFIPYGSHTYQMCI
jgi:hypothetical protein